MPVGQRLAITAQGSTRSLAWISSRRPHYPFTFVQADAMTYPLDGFDAIHASPPCQGYSIMRNLPWLRGYDYPLLIDPIRERLVDSGVPWVIENVMGAKLPAGWLCGTMFGLPFFRHRFFEVGGWFWMQPSHEKHNLIIRPARSLGSRARDVVATRARNGAQRVGANVGHAAGVGLVREVMDCGWMSREEVTQAVPPIYTEFIGRQLLKAIQA